MKLCYNIDLQRKGVKTITKHNNIYKNLYRNKTGAQTNTVGKTKEVEKIK